MTAFLVSFVCMYRCPPSPLGVLFSASTNCAAPTAPAMAPVVFRKSRRVTDPLCLSPDPIAKAPIWQCDHDWGQADSYCTGVTCLHASESEKSGDTLLL